MAISEGQISISVPESCQARRFDSNVDHGLSHCMKAVDFVIETPSATIFLELKDPDAAPAERRADWITRLSSGEIDNNLKHKFRDTWLYLYGLGLIAKPVYYFVVIGLAALSTEALAHRSERLKAQLPINGPNGPWTNSFLSDCSVHNLESWNRSFSEFQASRQ